jgi:hypothetical protein
MVRLDAINGFSDTQGCSEDGGNSDERSGCQLSNEILDNYNQLPSIDTTFLN